MSLDAYRETLLDHARRPRHAGRIEEATAHGTCTNPLCGDRVELSVRIESGLIREIRALTAGCSMSIASASLMCELVEGRSVNEAVRLRETLSESLLEEAAAPWPEDLAPLKPLSHLRESPTRVPCALMGWFALKDALQSCS